MNWTRSEARLRRDRGQRRVGEAPARHHAEHGREPAEVSQLAAVAGEHALVQVAEQVVGLNAHIGAVQAALECLAPLDP
jgi:hypothetical protein